MATTLASALRLVKPGEMVVSVTDILDKIGNKLTSDEKQQLLIALLSRRTETIRPGDLITSDLINQVLVDLAELKLRVDRLGQVTSPPDGRIVIRFPTEKDIFRVGEALTLIGENIPQDASVQLDTKSVGGIVVSADGTRLTIARIPDLAPPPEGRVITVTLVSAREGATAKFLLKASDDVKPTGSLTVVQSGGPGPSEKIKAGGRYDFTFKVTADTRPDETFQIIADIGRSDWTLEKPAEILIEAAVDANTPTVKTIKIGVVISQNAHNSDAGSLSLKLQSRRKPELYGILKPEIPITVDETAVQTRALALTLDSAAGDAGISTDKTTAFIGASGGVGGTGQINLMVTSTKVGGNVAAGSYQVNLAKLAKFEGDDTANPKWSAIVPGTSNGTVTLGSGTPTFAIEVTAKGGAGAAKLEVELVKVGETSIDGVTKFNVALEP